MLKETIEEKTLRLMKAVINFSYDGEMPIEELRKNHLFVHTCKVVELAIAEERETAKVKTRAEVADFLDKQELTEREKPRWHYGKQELRDLLDFIYGGPPASEGEELKRLMGVVSEK